MTQPDAVEPEVFGEFDGPQRLLVSAGGFGRIEAADGEKAELLESLSWLWHVQPPEIAESGSPAIPCRTIAAP